MHELRVAKGMDEWSGGPESLCSQSYVELFETSGTMSSASEAKGTDRT
jgi:hypothetical protein